MLTRGRIYLHVDHFLRPPTLTIRAHAHLRPIPKGLIAKDMMKSPILIILLETAKRSIRLEPVSTPKHYACGSNFTQVSRDHQCHHSFGERECIENLYDGKKTFPMSIIMSQHLLFWLMLLVVIYLVLPQNAREESSSLQILQRSQSA